MSLSLKSDSDFGNCPSCRFFDLEDTKNCLFKAFLYSPRFWQTEEEFFKSKNTDGFKEKLAAVRIYIFTQALFKNKI